MRNIHLFLVLLMLVGCGMEDPYGLVKKSDHRTKDLLLSDCSKCTDTSDCPECAVTIDALREYVLNKKLSKKWSKTPFKVEDDGRGDIDDLMWGLTLVQELHGINPIFALALSIHESAWGTSKQGREKNNLWGWNSGYCDANNRCGDSFDQATGFGSYGNGFNRVFRLIKRNYLTKGGNYYHECGNNKRVACVGGDIKRADACGASLAGMNCSYAEDDNWGKLVRSHMNNINDYINNHYDADSNDGSDTASTCDIAED